MSLRLHAVSHDSAACRAAGWPTGTPCAPSSHASAAHESWRCVVAQGLEVSRGEVFNTRLSRLRFATRRFSLEFSCYLQPTVLLTPAEVRLLHDTGFLT